MALRPSTEIAFDEQDPSPIVAVLREQLARKRGWVNLQPEVEEGHEPPPRGLGFAIFSGRGAPVPLVTWTAPEDDESPITVGIQHGSGAKAIDRLAGADLPLGPGWFQRANHPRRGLVVEIPTDEDAVEVLRWLIAASHVLSVPPLTGSWLADVYDGDR